MKFTHLFTLAILLSQVTNESFSSEIMEKKLFTLEKSLNSENILMIHTQTNENCKFVANQNGYLDFYWLMEGRTKKEVHSMIRSKVAERVKFVGISEDKSTFTVKLNDLSELRTDLQDNKIDVTAQLENGECVVKSIIKLGASSKYKKLNLKSTFCEVDKNLVGVPKGCKYLDLRGKDADTNEVLNVRFKGK